MADDPLDTVYAYVERTYVRLQAGDLLLRCLDEGDTASLNQMVEGLVLAGPQSLGALQEVLAVAQQQKSQVLNDLHEVYALFETNLKKYGVRLMGAKTPLALARLSAPRFLKMLREQQLTDTSAQVACMQMFQDSRELLRRLTTHLRLLDEIERYLQDWLWGLAYQSVRAEIPGQVSAH